MFLLQNHQQHKFLSINCKNHFPAHDLLRHSNTFSLIKDTVSSGSHNRNFYQLIVTIHSKAHDLLRHSNTFSLSIQYALPANNCNWLLNSIMNERLKPTHQLSNPISIYSTKQLIKGHASQEAVKICSIKEKP